MLEKLFYNHGFFCASHPWEVIVFTLTFTLSILFMGNQLNSNTVCVVNKNCNSDSDKNTYVILMTIIRCMAVLYIYHQFRNLRKLGSKHILGIVGLFTVFSSFVFSSSVMNFLQRDFAALNEALPFFLLLNDLSKASLLAQFALTSSNQKEVRDNIARGMSLRGPNITLDTVVGTLVIGVGSLSGVKHLDVMCCFACLSVIVNYLVFMTFFPACLSLVLELSGDMNDQNPVWQVTSFARSLHEDEQKPNLILQRVKLIMSAGLFLVHAHSRWPITTEFYTGPEVNSDESKTVNINEESMLARWFRVNPDQVVIFILAVFLTIKYIFFESHNREEIIVPVLSEHQIEIASTNVACSSVSKISSREKIINLDTKFTQTVNESNELVGRSLSPSEPRSIPKCLEILKSEGGVALSDDEIIRLLSLKHISSYQLEKVVEDTSRAVYLRRRLLYSRLENESALQNVPYINYDYCGVTGVCCENVIGYVPIPLGVAGPLLMNGKTYFIPMATTEGCLVASTNRGCRALMLSGGVQCSVLKDFMTRGPVVRFESAKRLVEAKQWLEQNENFIQMKSSFDSTSRFARLQRLKTAVAGLLLFIRFEASTGDAMGMNMLTKGTEKALKNLKDVFPDMEVISLSGNYCTDKKPTAINWIEGRGKEVACYATIPEHVVRDVLKTSISALIDVNTNKNLIGSAMAGALGGFNAQAANIVAAIFIATGQDPAQTVTSSNCMTLISLSRSAEDSLDVSVNMPSLEVGTIGGGTTLSPQAACLDMLGVKGSCDTNPGQNASTLACVIGATVLAGELSLLAALSAGHLVNSHMKHNRPSKSQ